MMSTTILEAVEATPIHPFLQRVIQEFDDVLKEPHGLPLEREHDHQIHLKEGSQPVNQRGYKVPYIQKIEIKR